MSDTELLEAPPAAAEDACPHCDSPQKDSRLGWCRRCGFVPRLRTFVELDPWDREPEPAGAPEPEPRHKNLLKAVPPWGWRLAGILSAIVAVSIFARLITPADSTARMVFALVELGGGLLVFLMGHLACYVFVIMETDKFNFQDIVLKPVAIWSRIIRDLPVTFKRLAITSGGLMAALMAVTVVRGIPYEKIWEGGPVVRAKTSLIEAIADAARKADGNQDSLEKAVTDFAEKSVDKAVEIAKAKEKEEANERRMTSECVIAGFVPAGDDFSELILVSRVDGHVQCVGTVSADIPPEVRAELNRRLRQIERAKPFVSCGVSGAQWVDPQLMCRIKFKEWSSGNRMIKPHFDDMMADIATK